jgi:hypothetical protein
MMQRKVQITLPNTDGDTFPLLAAMHQLELDTPVHTLGNRQLDETVSFAILTDLTTSELESTFARYSIHRYQIRVLEEFTTYSKDTFSALHRIKARLKALMV